MAKIETTIHNNLENSIYDILKYTMSSPLLNVSIHVWENSPEDNVLKYGTIKSLGLTFSSGRLCSVLDASLFVVDLEQMLVCLRYSRSSQILKIRINDI